MRDFTLEDMKTQFGKFAKPGWMQRMLRVLPGMSELTKIMEGEDTSQQIGRLVGIINSMTPRERCEPLLIDSHRCRRIAHGAGVSNGDVQSVLKQFETMKALMIRMAGTNLQPRIWRRRRDNGGPWN